MTPHLSPLCLTKAQVLTDGHLLVRPVAMADGILLADEGAGLPQVDLSGYLLLPGIIDLHGDGFERQIAPRPTAPFPISVGLACTDRDMAAHGVTTAYLAQSWSWEGGLRSPDQAETLMAELTQFRPRALTDLRIQVRAETYLVEAVDRLIAAVERFGIDYVVFNDHLEEGWTMQSAQPDRFAIWALKAGIAPEVLAHRINTARARAAEVPRALCALANAFDRLGVHYGSHDDADPETRQSYAMLGARIAEFPTGHRAAQAARAAQNPVIMGAPNVVRGGSQTGNIAAEDLIRQGLCDALVSDYHVPALSLAAWALVDRGVLDLPTAWALISVNPAAVLRMADRGRIAPGLRADLVVVNPATRAIEATISHGRISHLSGAVAARFLGAQPALANAAAAE